MLKRIVVLLFFVQVSFGQEYGNDIDTMKLCSSLQANNFGTDAEAERGLEKILSVIGASKRFVLQPCDNINNAVATAYKGIRYILYDRQFMNSISNGNNWGNLFILAHEVGHHINGHSLDLVLYMAEVVEPSTLALKRQQELEADEFAGFILSKLGGSLQDARTSIINVSSTGDDSYSTHPSRDKRLAAVEKGFNNAKSSEPPAMSKVGLANEYFYKAANDFNVGNYTKALENVTVAIALKSDDGNFYQLKGDIQAFQKNFTGAIDSYDKSIELNPQSYWSHQALGHMYLILSEESEDNKINLLTKSENNFLKAITLNPEKEASSHFSLGRVYFEKKNLSKAIEYLNTSIKIEPTKSSAYYYRGLSYGFMDNNYKAISDFTSLIENSSDVNEKALGYYWRSIGKRAVGDDDGYCSDLKAAHNLNPNGGYLDESCN